MTIFPWPCRTSACRRRRGSAPQLFSCGTGRATAAQVWNRKREPSAQFWKRKRRSSSESCEREAASPPTVPSKTRRFLSCSRKMRSSTVLRCRAREARGAWL
eukprot:2234154-Prymnesium_polylepis.1